MIKDNESKNDKRCIRCKKYQLRKEFIDSEGWTCNTCFEPSKRVLELSIGDPVVYVSKVNKDGNKRELREEMEVFKTAEKIGTRWYIELKSKKAPGSSLVLVSSCESIKQ